MLFSVLGSIFWIIQSSLGIWYCYNILLDHRTYLWIHLEKFNLGFTLLSLLVALIGHTSWLSFGDLFGHFDWIQLWSWFILYDVSMCWLILENQASISLELFQVFHHRAWRNWSFYTLWFRAFNYRYFSSSGASLKATLLVLVYL